MKPLQKTTATMNTTPATMPTHAATGVSRRTARLVDPLGGRGCGGGGVVVATGLVAGSEVDVGSLITQSMQTVLMRFS